MITGACFSAYLVYLIIERILLASRLRQISLRICVTGTRGKSSVVRLISACLRESRMLVLAKTTGSKPCLIFPDGEEEEIQRAGQATVLEGKKALGKAIRTGVHAVVLEMMSIRPEALRMEAIQMTKPHILVITNIREDHVDEMGRSKEEIARNFASALPRKSTVFIPEEECYPVFRKKAQRAGVNLVSVPSGFPEGFDEYLPAGAFECDYRLALAVTDFLGKDRKRAFRAAVRAAPDLGSLKVWMAREDSPLSGWYFVSAFAANDPESTKDALTKVERSGLFSGKKKIALLNLRKDRGGRTIQWFHALQQEAGYAFDRLILTGEHAVALKKRLQGRIKTEMTVLKGKRPDELISQIDAIEKRCAVVFGMGNMGGIGRELVEFWEATGIEYDV